MISLRRGSSIFAFAAACAAVWALPAACVRYETDSATSGGAGASGPAAQHKFGLCLDRCPKACSGDGDCDASQGQLCCNIGGASICTEAKACPKRCSADTDCPTQDGEACVQVTLASSQKVCAPPKAAVKACSTDQQCGAGDVCCGIYSQPVCLPADRCPKSCTAGDQCDNASGELCCGTMRRIDPTLREGGLCLDPQVVPCPTACSTSSQCDNHKGELCCEGTCSTHCVKECDQSSDCDGQVCCQASLVEGPLLNARPPAGYPTGHFGAQSVSAGPTSTGTGGGCTRCLQWAEGHRNGPLCDASQQPWMDLQSCGCNACNADCADMCNGGPLPSACVSCLETNCGSTLQACVQN